MQRAGAKVLDLWDLSKEVEQKENKLVRRHLSSKKGCRRISYGAGHSVGHNKVNNKDKS